MRLDKFLKVSRILKRRTVANEACTNGRVTVNGRVAKPSVQLKSGDVVEIAFGSGALTFEVLELNESSKKADADKMYRIIGE